MSLESKRRTRRKRYAIAGATVFGAGIPAASYGLSFPLQSDGLLYGGPSVAFVAYVLHAFLLNRRAHSPIQWLTVITTAAVGGLFFAWFHPVCDLISTLGNPHPRPTAPGDIGDLGFFGIIFGSIASGTAMSLLLWAATRSWRVALALVGASLLCGLLSVPTNGMSSILWNICFAVVLYSWACRQQLSWQDPGPPACEHCGYSLYGLSVSICPECGKPV